MKQRTGKLSDLIVNYFLLIVIAIAVLVFALQSDKFFTMNNIFNILRSTSTLGTVAVGLTVCWGTGEMDFSIGTECTAGAVICGMLLTYSWFNSYLLAILAALLAMAVMGLCNALLTLKLHIPSFIATMGMSTIVGGLLKLWTNNSVVFYPGWPDAFTAMTRVSVFGIPLIFPIFLTIAALAGLFLEKTGTGRYITAVGTNPAACRQVGINVDKVKTIAFILCAVIVAFGGVMYASVVNTVSASSGINVLDGICVVLLGATFLRGGQSNIYGTVVASLLMGIITQGMALLGMSTYAKNIVQGLIIAIAVSAIAIKKKGTLPVVSFG